MSVTHHGRKELCCMFLDDLRHSLRCSRVDCRVHQWGQHRVSLSMCEQSAQTVDLRGASSKNTRNTVLKPLLKGIIIVYCFVLIKILQKVFRDKIMLVLFYSCFPSILHSA